MDIKTLVQYVEGLPKAYAPEDLTRFETKLGAPLSEEYVAFLDKCNGGYLGSPIGFNFTNSESRVDRTGISFICGLRDDEEELSLDEMHICYHIDQKMLPSSMICIMVDDFGNPVCLGFNGEEAGRVFYWDRSGVQTDPPPNEFRVSIGCIYEISTSFNSFIEIISLSTSR